MTDFSSLLLGRRRRVQTPNLPGPPRIQPAARPNDLFVRPNIRRQRIQLTDFTGLSQTAAQLVALGQESKERSRREAASKAIEDDLSRKKRDAGITQRFGHVLDQGSGPINLNSPLAHPEGGPDPRPKELKETRREIAKLGASGKISPIDNPLLAEVVTETHGAILGHRGVDALLQDMLPLAGTYDPGIQDGRLPGPKIGADDAIHQVFQNLKAANPYLDRESPQFNRRASEKFLAVFYDGAREFRRRARASYEKDFITKFVNGEGYDRFAAAYDANDKSEDAKASLAKRLDNVMEEVTRRAGVPRDLVDTVQTKLQWMGTKLGEIHREHADDPFELEEALEEALDVFGEIKLGTVKAKDHLQFQNEIEGRFRELAHGTRGGGLGSRTQAAFDRTILEEGGEIFRDLRERLQDQDPTNDHPAIQDAQRQLVARVKAFAAEKDLSVGKTEQLLLQADSLAEKWTLTYSSRAAETPAAARDVVRLARKGDFDAARSLMRQHTENGTLPIGSAEELSLIVELERIEKAHEFKGSGTPFARLVTQPAARLDGFIRSAPSSDETQELLDQVEDGLGAIDSAFDAFHEDLLEQGKSPTEINQELAKWTQTTGRQMRDDAMQPLKVYQDQVDTIEAEVTRANTNRRFIPDTEFDQIVGVVGKAKAAQFRQKNRAVTNRVALDNMFAQFNNSSENRLRDAISSAIQTNPKLQEELVKAEDQKAMTRHLLNVYRARYRTRMDKIVASKVKSGSDTFSADVIREGTDILQELEEDLAGGLTVAQETVDLVAKAARELNVNAAVSSINGADGLGRAHLNSGMRQLVNQYQDTKDLIGGDTGEAILKFLTEKHLGENPDSVAFRRVLNNRAFNLFVQKGLSKEKRNQVLYDMNRSLSDLVSLDEVETGKIKVLFADKDAAFFLLSTGRKLLTALTSAQSDIAAKNSRLAREQFGSSTMDVLEKEGLLVDVDKINLRSEVTLFHTSAKDLTEFAANESRVRKLAPLLGMELDDDLPLDDQPDWVTYVQRQKELLRIKGLN